MLRICLLGQPCFYWDDKLLKFTAPPRALPLLGYLLLHRDQPIERQYLACLLWPDGTESSARTNLRRHLNQLNNFLPPSSSGDPWLLVDTETLRWNPAAEYWLDMAEFERLSAAPETMAEAVKLYGGDLLETLYDDWVVYARERLRERYLSALMQLTLRHRTRQDYHQAAAYAQTILTRDPLREDVLRLLMSLRYQAGDGAGALHAYNQFARLLRQEMGIDPMPETATVYEAVLHNRPLPATGPSDSAAPITGAPAAGAPAQRLGLPFVGREAEMTQLAAAWQHAARGEGGMVMISGEAGIGKTRLAREFALQVESQGARVLYGSTALSEAAPYQAIRNAFLNLLPLLAVIELDPVWLSALAVLVPELRQRRHLPELPPLNADSEQMRLFEALRRSLEALAHPRPVLLILEDLHAAGADTLAMVNYLTWQLDPMALLILVTYREEEALHDRPLRQLTHTWHKERRAGLVALKRLQAQSIAALLNLMECPEPAINKIAASLYTTSDGNPLFVDLLLQQWTESSERSADTTWRLPDDSPVILAGDLRQVVQQRMAHLSQPAQALAEVAAVAGQAFDFELVCKVSGWSEGPALDALGELIDRHLVREAAGRTRFDYAFNHPLVQLAIYDAIPAGKRRRRHRRVAQAMESLYGHNAIELAGEIGVHYERGGNADRACVFYEQAARHSLALYADEKALDYVTRSLALMPAEAPANERFDRLALRELIYDRRGERTAQWADLQQMEQLAQSLPDVRLVCQALYRRSLYHSVLGERQDQAECILQLAASAEQAGDPYWLAQFYLAEGKYQLLISDYAQAQANLEQAAAYYRVAADEAGEVAAYCALADVAVQQGHFKYAREWLARATQLAATQANRSLMVQTMRTASGALFTRQDFEAAGALAQQMLELCQAIGDREGEADALARLASVAARDFRVREARQFYAEAAQLYNAMGKRQGQAAVMVNTVMLLVGRQGLYAEGLALIRQASEIFGELGDLRGQIVCALNEGMIAAYLEEYAEARAASRRGLEMARQINNRVMEANALANLGAAERDLGELDQAIAHMEAGLAIRRSLDQVAELGCDLCDLTVAYCRKGQLAAARQAAEEMLSLYEQAESAMMHPQYILWAAAQTFYALGDLARAKALLEQAGATMHQKAEAISEDESRANYYNLPFNRQILAASERGDWGQVVV